MTRPKTIAKPVNLILANKERLIPISVAVELFPVVGGRSKSLVSVYRYIARGCGGIVLESVVDGGRIYVSRPSVKRFLTAIATARAGRYATSREAKPVAMPVNSIELSKASSKSSTKSRNP